MSQDYVRKCENSWLHTFRDWIEPRSEAPTNYIMWAGLYTLAAALRRKVFIPSHYMGGYEVFPHMYLMLVGPPGMRKTTTVRRGAELLAQIPCLTEAPPIASSAGIIEDIVKSEDASLYLIVEEFGDFLLKTGFEMYEFLTGMYDNKIKLHVKTVAHARQVAERPVLNMTAATTPGWISENMPQGIVTGGFASRVVFVCEEEIPDDKLEIFYDHIDTNFSEIEIKLRDDLAHIANSLNGPFKIDDEAKEWIRHWYKKIHKNKSPSPKLAGYMMRKPQHLLKIAMLMRISHTDDLTITLPEAQAALNILETIEPNILKAFEGLGKNKYTLDHTEIVKFLRDVKSQGKTIEQFEVFRHFRPNAEPAKLVEIVEFAISTRDIKRVRRGVTLDNGAVEERTYLEAT